MLKYNYRTKDLLSIKADIQKEAQMNLKQHEYYRTELAQFKLFR